MTIEYLKEQTEYILYYKDLSGAAIISLKELLEKALNFKLQIENEYKDKGIGYYHSIYTNNIYANKLQTAGSQDLIDPTKDFLVWSTLGPTSIGTFIYNDQDKIYIEISPLYEWFNHIFDDILEEYNEVKDEDASFDDFLNNYKPIDIVAIDRKVAEKWLEFCCEMIEILKANDKKQLK